MPIFDYEKRDKERKTKNEFSSSMRKWVKILIFNGIVLVILLLFTEGILRAGGKKPYTFPEVTTSVQPANYGCVHPQMGFSLRPGKYCFKLAEQHEFCATHTRDSLRATSYEPLDSIANKIHLYGCSLTYGYGVADSQTFAWQMQQHFSSHEVRNYGVSGYSLTQMFERMKHAYAKGGRPDLAIIAYASFHDERNAMLRHWRKSLMFRENDFAGDKEIWVPSHRVRWGRMSEEKRKLSWEPWPLMQTSALVHATERGWNEMEFSWIKTRIISFSLMGEIQRWCKARNIPLVIAGMDHNKFTLRAMTYFENIGLYTVDLAVDDALCGMTFQPIDPHPTALAHKQFADALIVYIRAKKLL